MEQEKLAFLKRFVDSEMKTLQGEILSLFELILPSERQVEKARKLVFDLVQRTNRSIQEKIDNLDKVRFERFVVR